MLPILYLSSFLSLAHAAPVPGLGSSLCSILPFLCPSSSSSNGLTQITNETIHGNLVRPAQFSRVAYCSAGAVQPWNCGPPCQSLGTNVKVLATGGDNGLVPDYFVAYDQDAETVVVSHQGTDPTNLLSILNDAEVGQETLDSAAFPQSSDNRQVQVHAGFHQTFLRTASTIQATVQSALNSTKATNILFTGHSLGAAIATLGAVSAHDTFPNTNINAVVFESPRVGNQDFADLVDSLASSSSFTFKRITNQNDEVPNLPLQLMNYRHPSGEVHIQSVNPSTGQAIRVVSCPGQDNSQCSAGVPILENLGNLAGVKENHLGPFFEDISMGTTACSL